MALSALVEDLHLRGLDHDVSVVVWGEFGRTPTINKDAGRDHWPPVNFALLAGGGMRTGQVIGSTDKQAAYAKDRPVSFQNVFATLYHNLGIDPADGVSDRSGRPMTLLDDPADPRADLTGDRSERGTSERSPPASRGGGLLGSLIGLERQRLDKAAGLRTHMLVSVGSALIMIVSAYGFDRVIDPGRVVLDPSRWRPRSSAGSGSWRRHDRGEEAFRARADDGGQRLGRLRHRAGRRRGPLHGRDVRDAIMLVILAIVKPFEDRLLGHGPANAEP